MSSPNWNNVPGSMLNQPAQYPLHFLFEPDPETGRSRFILLDRANFWLGQSEGRVRVQPVLKRTDQAC